MKDCIETRLMCLHIREDVFFDVNGLEDLLRQLLEALEQKSYLLDRCASTVEMTLCLSNDAKVRELNARFRGKDKPTNILSFPNDEVLPGESSRYLGDMIVALETLKEEALFQRKGLKEHMCHLILHGILHLYGYDHIVDTDAEEMEALEIEILNEIGLKNPYEL